MKTFTQREKKCAVCGKPFTQTKVHQMCCSLECNRIHVQNILAKKGTRICKHCGKEFVPKHFGCHYCSKECQSEATRIRCGYVKPHEVVCETCGKTFIARNSRIKNCPECCAAKKTNVSLENKAKRTGMDVLTCSTCGKKFVGIRNLDDNGRELPSFCSKKCKRKAELEEHGSFVCVVCGKEFVPTRMDQVCCSKECKARRKVDQRKAWTKRRSLKRARRHVVETRNCAFCGKPFTFDSNLHNKRFCSDTCKRKAETDRRRDQMRPDTCAVKVAQSLPTALDGLRDQKGVEYFRVLSTLGESEQLAEMQIWTPEEHADYLTYIGQNDSELREREMNETIPTFKPDEPKVFDEEDHG